MRANDVHIGCNVLINDDVRRYGKEFAIGTIIGCRPRKAGANSRGGFLVHVKRLNRFIRPGKGPTAQETAWYHAGSVTKVKNLVAKPKKGI